MTETGANLPAVVDEVPGRRRRALGVVLIALSPLVVAAAALVVDFIAFTGAWATDDDNASYPLALWFAAVAAGSSVLLIGAVLFAGPRRLRSWLIGAGLALGLAAAVAAANASWLIAVTSTEFEALVPCADATLELAAPMREAVATGTSWEAMSDLGECWITFTPGSIDEARATAITWLEGTGREVNTRPGEFDAIEVYGYGTGMTDVVVTIYPRDSGGPALVEIAMPEEVP